MLPKNLKQPNSFHITKNPRMILGGKFIGAIDIKCLNTWSNIALIIADSFPELLNQDPIAFTETTLTCHHPLCQFYNLPILATP